MFALSFLLLKKKGLQYKVMVSNFAEDLDKSKFTPAQYVMENAFQKAKHVYLRATKVILLYICLFCFFTCCGERERERERERENYYLTARIYFIRMRK